MTVEEKALAYYEKIINECFKITNKKNCQEEFIKSKDIILKTLVNIINNGKEYLLTDRYIYAILKAKYLNIFALSTNISLILANHFMLHLRAIESNSEEETIMNTLQFYVLRMEFYASSVEYEKSVKYILTDFEREVFETLFYYCNEYSTVNNTSFEEDIEIDKVFRVVACAALYRRDLSIMTNLLPRFINNYEELVRNLDLNSFSKETENKIYGFTFSKERKINITPELIKYILNYNYKAKMEIK